MFFYIYIIILQTVNAMLEEQLKTKPKDLESSEQSDELAADTSETTASCNCAAKKNIKLVTRSTQTTEVYLSRVVIINRLPIKIIG